MIDLDRLKANVFPGESGGDYGALFGYSNRPGGQFEGVNLTDMTVDEALQFANPSGPYGQWVKGQVGRVATPMGAFQVVGSTLRAAKEGLGLTGKERMTPETQDRIGQWIYQTQGPSAWEAWGKGGNMQPQGLLGMMSTRNAPDQEQLPFFQRPQTQDLLDRLAIGFGGMTLRPNTGLIQAAQERIGARREDAKTQRQINKTLDYLRSLNTPQAAEALRYAAATGDITNALKIAREGPGYQVFTGTQLIEQYGVEPGAVDPNALYNRSGDGQITKVGGGGANVTVVNAEADADAEFFKKFYGGLGTEFANVRTQAAQAAANVPALSALRELYSVAPSGPISGRLAELFPEANDVSAAIESVRVQLAPQLRVEGSGSTSDIEYDGMLRSLGSMRNNPAANQALLDLMLLKSDVLQAKSAVASQVRPNGLSPMDALQQFDEIERTMWKESPRLKSINALIASAGAATPAVTGQTSGTTAGVPWRIID